MEQAFAHELPEIHVGQLGWFLHQRDPQVMKLNELLEIINQLPRSEVRGYLVGVHHTRTMQKLLHE